MFPSHCQGQVLCPQHDLGSDLPTWVSHSVPRLSSRVRLSVPGSRTLKANPTSPQAFTWGFGLGSPAFARR